MTQLQEAIRDKITKYSDACGMCTDIMKDCDICGVIWIIEDLNELQKLANDPDAVRPTAHWQGEYDGYADGNPVYDVWNCSACGYCIDDGTDDPDMLPKYCPGCGSRMIDCEDGEHR